MANFLQSAAKVLGTTYDYLTPGLGSSRLTDYGTRSNTTTPAPAPRPPASTPSYDPSGKIAELNKQLQASQAAYAATQAQIAAMPRIQHYDTTSAYANATKAAQSKVDPVYADKLNQYLQQAKLQRDQQTRAEQEREADINTTLSQTTEDIAKNKARTGEDLTTGLGDVSTSEGNYQTNTGTAFDRARAALIGTQGQTGADLFGLGQGQQQQAIDDRNTSEGQQTVQFDNQRRDLHTNASRNFEDLDTSQNRAAGAATTGTTRSKQQLQDFIDNANLDEQAQRTNLETERQGAIAAETQNQYKLGAQQFIASLVGHARDQDILATKQFLGV